MLLREQMKSLKSQANLNSESDKLYRKSLLILCNNNNLAMYTTITGELLQQTTSDLIIIHHITITFFPSKQCSTERPIQVGKHIMSLADLNCYYVASQWGDQIMVPHQLQLTPMHHNGLSGNFSQLYSWCPVDWLIVLLEYTICTLKLPTNFWLQTTDPEAWGGSVMYHM
jgi:hypothetical protein